MQENILQTTMVIMLWEFLMFYQIILSPQMKQSLKISKKTGIYELLYELRVANVLKT